MRALALYLRGLVGVTFIEAEVSEGVLGETCLSSLLDDSGDEKLD